MSADLIQTIRERYLRAQENIARAAQNAGRDPTQVKLVVVTKTQPVETVRAAIAAGVHILGENYPAEGVMKIQYTGGISAVEWHMIGHVQSRKAALVAQHFNFLHSLDSSKLAEKLNQHCRAAGRTLPVLLEFNVGGEESKSGWQAADETRWAELLQDVASIANLPHLQIRGLMTMPPLGATAEFSRPFFQKIKRLQAYLRAQLPQVDFTELSMGTSADYEIAVEEGATFVRIGTSIVGARHYPPEVS